MTGFEILHGDVLQVLPTLPEASDPSMAVLQ
jgi:hypothetical protein